MDKSEVKKLWALLAELYPRQKQAATPERLGAWALALEPYGYEQIREAALAHARRNEYYPSIAELTDHLPKAEVRSCTDAGSVWEQWIADGRAKDAADELGSVSKYAREHNMTWNQAKEALSNDAGESC